MIHNFDILDLMLKVQVKLVMQRQGAGLPSVFIPKSYPCIFL